MLALALLLTAAPCPSVTATDVRWLHTSPETAKPAVEAPAVPEGLELRVAFWERIWGELEAGQLALVDERRPWVVHAEVDCRGQSERACDAKQADAKKRAAVALRDKSERDRLYGKHSKLALDAGRHFLFVEGRKDGLERVLAKGAADVAAAEAMFDLAKVPRAYARLAVVESMMRADARSSAGALGTYQLMPLIASKYLMVREGIDERLDPVRSSLAAAKYLKRLKGELGTWPHALTAYNTGPTRLRAVMKRAKTREVAKIVNEPFHSQDRRDGFGWASQNYYAKVAAVARVTDALELQRRANDDVAVRLDKKMKLSDLAACVAVDQDELAAANPSIVDVTKPVPKGYLARVPRMARVGG